MSDRLNEARKAHERGWALTPLRGKIPKVTEWQKQPAPTLEQVERWAKDGNVGLRCGQISGVYVVDEDTRKGGAFHDPPTTPTVLTGGGGKHYYFEHPGDGFLGNSASKIGPHIDTRGDGGQVVFVGSVHPETKQAYRWAPGLSPDEVPLAPLPAWVLDILRPKRRAPAPANANHGPMRARSNYALRALDEEARNVASAPNGARNDTLNRSAFNLGTLIPNGYLDRSTVEGALMAAAHQNGMIEDDGLSAATATLNNGIAAGMLNPRTIEDRPQFRVVGPSECPPDAEIEDEPEEAPEPRQSEPAKVDSLDLPPICWRKGFQEFREASSRSTEASDAFIWGAYLTAASLVIGRNATLDSGVEVYPNVFVTAVGASGKARKSTAQGYFRRLMRSVDESVLSIAGIGSPEGLVQALSDGGSSRRCVVDINELSSMLLKASAEATRGLGPLLTTLYDCPPSVRLPNRKSDLTATEPYLCIIASTTQDWLQRDLSSADVAGGLANRFIYLCGPEKDPIPFPPKRDPYLLSDAEAILTDAMVRHSSAVTYPLAAGADELWAWWYTEERKRAYESPILETMAQRLHLTAWKVALVFAGLEGTGKITKGQLAAAIAFADYQRDVHRVIFEGYGDNEAKRVEQRILKVLSEGAIPLWKLQQRVRKVDAETLHRRVRALALVGTIRERKTSKATLLEVVNHA